MTERSRLRKRPLETDTAAAARALGEIDIAACATVAYSSEDPAHPVKICLMSTRAREARVGCSARPDTIENIVVEFDQPQTISRLVYEVEEMVHERTQEVRVRFRTMAVERIARFLSRNIISVLAEPPISARSSALISTG